MLNKIKLINNNKNKFKDNNTFVFIETIIFKKSDA